MTNYSDYCICIPIMDRVIINVFFNSVNKINVNRIKPYYLNKNNDLKHYLTIRFNDSTSVNETLYRIKNNIEIRPKCYCGKDLKYYNNGKFSQFCSRECFYASSEVKNKRKQTNILKYGGKSPCSSADVVNKMINTRINKYGSKSYHNIELYTKTMLEKYGVNHNFKDADFKLKRKITWLNNYNCENPSQSEKIKNKKKKTYLDHYGVDSFFKSEEFKKFYQDNKELIINRSYNTRRENGTLAQSKIENEIYKLIKTKYPDVIHHYKDNNRYPFNCDFYIPSLDLFIEYNGHWTHNNHIFNKNDENDFKLLEEMKKHAMTSKYYANAINTWTIRDVLKFETAKNNNLNYLILWTDDYLNNRILKIIDEKF